MFKQNNNLMNIWNLSQTIAHMKSVKDLDRRCLFITVHLKDSSAFESLNRTIWEFTKIYFVSDRHALKRNPGLFSSLDFEGSKKGNITQKFPHIHSVLVFAKQTPEGVIDNFIMELSDFLGKHPLVDSSFKTPVLINRFENRTKNNIKKKDQIENLIDYCKKSSLVDKRDTKTVVLPYEDIIGLDNKLSDKIARSARSHFDNFKNTKNMQDYYSSQN